MNIIQVGWLLLAVLAAAIEGKTLWASTSAQFSNIVSEAYPVGNGRLGAMPFSSPGAEKVNLNVDSLWSGGPFQYSNYSGGNPLDEVHEYLGGIRQWVFQNGTGNVSQLLYSDFGYGTFQVLGNLSVTIDGINFTTNYNRSLNLATGVHTTSFAANGKTYSSTVYCSYPDQVCVYQINSDHALPKISVLLENQLVDPNLLTQTCGEGYVRLSGYTQLGPPSGMKYDAIARALPIGVGFSCNSLENGSLAILPGSQTKHITLVVGAGTDYDQTKGNAASNYSFKGDDPGPYVENVTSKATAKGPDALLQRHIEDYTSLMSAFSLELPDPNNSSNLETSVIISSYNSSGEGDPYLESLLFDYARHLFTSSSRGNSLPPNLAGKWTEQLLPAWGADYHSNINLQMNHWLADQTGLGNLQMALWRYMTDTWMPRGAETARMLYGGPGFVAHDEVNIFGHTGMKTDAQWANYPASAAWMMQHVWDHFEYSQDLDWLRQQGYPLLKGVAQFWLSQLQQDAYFNDGTLVVNPCNSPEHGPTTFGCTNYQQLIHQVFEAVLSSASLISEPDRTFLNNVSATLDILDKGFHIGTWGETKEWKIPDSYEYDFENDTHRHLSNLVGWHPGYSISSFLSGYTNSTIQSAVATTLYSRGTGNSLDADSGWEKVWRAACWARLNNTERAYFELRYAIDENFAGNGLSMYWATYTPFQIDANFGLGGAILSMLIVDLPAPYGSKETRTVVLGPAIPARWANGEVKGLRLRGGGSVEFSWNQKGIVEKAVLKGRKSSLKLVNKAGKVLAEI